MLPLVALRNKMQTYLNTLKNQKRGRLCIADHSFQASEKEVAIGKRTRWIVEIKRELYRLKPLQSISKRKRRRRWRRIA